MNDRTCSQDGCQTGPGPRRTAPVSAPPTFTLEEDGVHFAWSHTCPREMTLPDGSVTMLAFRDRTVMPNSDGTWHVVQQEPLTVQPSILCTGCGTHGFITEGVWVPV